MAILKAERLSDSTCLACLCVCQGFPFGTVAVFPISAPAEHCKTLNHIMSFIGAATLNKCSSILA